jgi:hypothetical protein
VSAPWDADVQYKLILDGTNWIADPNNPTSLHRIAKATIIDMLVQKYPLDMDKRASLRRILRTADIDADGDSLPDATEITMGTDPWDPDSDGDGFGAAMPIRSSRKSCG